MSGNKFCRMVCIIIIILSTESLVPCSRLACSLRLLMIKASKYSQNCCLLVTLHNRRTAESHAIQECHDFHEGVPISSCPYAHSEFVIIA